MEWIIFRILRAGQSMKIDTQIKRPRSALPGFRKECPSTCKDTSLADFRNVIREKLAKI
jgi:hypothetical protein